MRSAVPIIIGLILGACGGSKTVPTAPNAPSHVAASEDLKQKTFALVTRDHDGSVRSYCSGVWVSPLSILTANHCVDDVEIGGAVEYVVPSDVFAPIDLHPRAA